jgi:hypothetical protein
MYSKSYYTHKAWDLLCNECDQDMHPCYIITTISSYGFSGALHPHENGWGLPATHLQPTMRHCYWRLASYFRVWSTQQTDVYAGHTSQRQRHTEPTGPNDTASSWHFPNSANTPTYKFCGRPPVTRRSYFWTEYGPIHTYHAVPLPIPCRDPAILRTRAVYSYCGTGSV